MAGSLISILIKLLILISVIYLIYLIIKKKFKPNWSIILGTLIGLIIGVPLSYYFQTDWIQNATGSIAGYFEYLGNATQNKISENQAKNLGSNILTSVIIFGIVGLLIGVIISRTKKSK